MKNKILVIDDDEAILDATALILEDAGYVVEKKNKGKYICNMMKSPEALPDVIVLDTLLSGEDGRAIAKKLKNEKKTSNIPIIMMSASSDMGISALSSGADSFISKPFGIEDLLIKIKQFIPN